MALPNGVSACTVTFGPYLDQAGRPLQGSVTFVPSSDLTFNGAQLLRGPVVVKLANGLGSVVLPHTDQEGMTAGGFEVINWTYTAVIRFKSEVPGAMDIRPFSFSLPQELGDTWDLDTAVPIESVPGELIPTLVTAAQLAEAVAPAVSAAQSALSAANAVANALPTKVDKVAGKVLSDNNYSTADKSKLGGISDGATVNAPDSQLRDRGTHTGTQDISTVAGLQALLDSKVVSVSGKGLSTNDFTTVQKDKLAALSGASVYLPPPSPLGADQTAEIQAVISAMSPGQTLIVSNRYRVDGGLVVSVANVTIRGLGQGEFYSSAGTAAQTLIKVTASGVTLRGFAVIGPQFASGANQSGISIEGASAANPVVRPVISGMTVGGFGKNGILASHVHDFTIDDNVVYDCCYTGIGVMCGIGGSIDRNRIRNITQTGYVNTYGIYTSRYETNNLTTSPRSTNISICDNKVSDIPGWDGINTHGGSAHIISGNILTNCAKPIEIVGSDDGTQTAYAPLDIQIIANVMSSTKTDGSYPGGIVFVGAQGGNALGAPAEYGTGAIIGNVIKGHGKESTSTNGGIHAYYTKGLVIANNTVVEPGSNGIYMYHTNVDFTITGNVVVDPWTNSLGLACAISCGSDYNQGYVGGNNRLVRGSKSASVIASRGINISNLSNNVITLGDNVMDSASIPVYDIGSKVRAVGSAIRAGLISSRPAASSALHGASYLATDVEGGTSYRCIQTAGTTYAWQKMGAGVDAVASANVDGLWRPRDSSFIGCSGDPATALIANQTALTSGTQYVSRVKVDQSGSVASVMLYVATAGTSITEATVDIWNSSGARVGTADASTALASTGLKTISLAAATGSLTAGDTLWVGIRATFTGTAPAVRGLSTASIPNANAATGTRVRFGTAGTGVTSSQASITPSSIVSVNVGQQCHWVGLI